MNLQITLIIFRFRIIKLKLERIDSSSFGSLDKKNFRN